MNKLEKTIIIAQIAIILLSITITSVIVWIALPFVAKYW